MYYHKRFVCILYSQNIYIGIGLLQIDTFWDQGFWWTYDCLVQIKTAKQHNLILDRKSQFAFQSSCELRWPDLAAGKGHPTTLPTFIQEVSITSNKSKRGRKHLNRDSKILKILKRTTLPLKMFLSFIFFNISPSIQEVQRHVFIRVFQKNTFSKK